MPYSQASISPSFLIGTIKTSMKSLLRTLDLLKTEAENVGRKLLELGDSKTQLLETIKEVCKVEDPQPVYEKSYVILSEGVLDCLRTDDFFSSTTGGLVPNKDLPFLLELWSGDYYVDAKKEKAFQKFTEELKERGSMEFLEVCKQNAL